MAVEKKVKDLVVIDTRESSSVSEYIVIMSGTSDRHVQGVAEHIKETLSRVEVRPLGIEGMREGRWILMDYGNLVIHVFQEAVRLFYDIEGIWQGVPMARYDETGKKIMK